MSEDPKYQAKTKYLEECVHLVIVDMLERVPHLKKRIKKYLESQECK